MNFLCKLVIAKQLILKTKQQRRKAYHTKRNTGNPDYKRFQECKMSKMEVAMDMLCRGWKMGLHAKYVITDSWFTCEQLMACVRSIGKGAMHFVGLAKMGKTKYTVSGRKKNAAELITTYERERGKNCRKYKCRYIQLNGHLGNIPVRIFLIKYGRNSVWNVLLTTDTTMSFVKAFEVYQIRWNIEVMNKETKQYLGLGGYQGCDFNGQIADATLCYLTYTVMALEKRFTEYQTMGELFSDMEDDLMALTLWKRVLTCIERILRILGETLGITPQHLMATISGNDKELSKILVMAEALEKWDEVYGQIT